MRAVGYALVRNWSYEIYFTCHILVRFLIKQQKKVVKHIIRLCMYVLVQNQHKSVIDLSQVSLSTLYLRKIDIKV